MDVTYLFSSIVYDCNGHPVNLYMFEHVYIVYAFGYDDKLTIQFYYDNCYCPLLNGILCTVVIYGCKCTFTHMLYFLLQLYVFLIIYKFRNRCTLSMSRDIHDNIVSSNSYHFLLNHFVLSFELNYCVVDGCVCVWMWIKSIDSS